MSVVDQLKNLFSNKSADASTPRATSGDLSLAMADGTLDPMATSSALSMGQAEPDSVDDSIIPPAVQAELVAHHRTSSILALT